MEAIGFEIKPGMRFHDNNTPGRITEVMTAPPSWAEPGEGHQPLDDGAYWWTRDTLELDPEWVDIAISPAAYLEKFCTLIPA